LSFYYSRINSAAYKFIKVKIKVKVKLKVKVKQSRYRPGVAKRVPGS
jgi:hypothetical protein